MLIETDDMDAAMSNKSQNKNLLQFKVHWDATRSREMRLEWIELLSMA
jgi:uncharacterized iron-regulated protein